MPTEIEWEFAARGEMNRKKNTGIENKTTSEKEEEIKTDFPWDAQFSNATHSRGKYFANIKTGPSNYIEDNYEYTAPVKSFPANTFGLFEMAGNVSEWTADVFEFHHSPETANISPAQIPNDAQNLRVVKGGSWADYKYAAMCGSRTGLDGNKGYARVGFRVARNNED